MTFRPRPRPTPLKPTAVLHRQVRDVMEAALNSLTEEEQIIFPKVATRNLRECIVQSRTKYNI